MELIHKYSVNKFHIWKGILSSFIIFLGIGLVFHFVRPSAINDFGILNYVIVIGSVFLLFVLMELTIYFNYYYFNKGWQLTRYIRENRILIQKGNLSVSVELEEIEFIQQVRSFPFAEERIHWFPTDGYNYSVLNLKNGHKFIVTSLLVPRLELFLESEKIKLKKTFIAYIRESHFKDLTM
jgi:hypothetical protein